MAAVPYHGRIVFAVMVYKVHFLGVDVELEVFGHHHLVISLLERHGGDSFLLYEEVKVECNFNENKK
jgi:hypothetical protein